MALLTPCMCMAQVPTAQSILKQAADKYKKAGGLSATYTLISGSDKQSGSLKTKGNAFAVEAGQYSTWYDGITLWDYNPTDNEVTVSNPTKAEMSAINPYAILSSYQNEYKVQLVTSNIKGTYAVLLIPKSAQSPFKSATLCLKAADLQPVRLDLTAHNGAKTSIIITNIHTTASLPSSTFKFPTSRYPGVKTADMR